MSDDRRGQKRRLANNSACDHCRHRKIGCNGEMPCEACVKRSGDCTYSMREELREMANKKKRLEKPASAPAGAAEPEPEPAPIEIMEHSPSDLLRNESVLSNGLMANFYLRMYTWHLNPVVQLNSFAHPPALSADPTREEHFQFMMTVAITARGLGHAQVANELYKQCQSVAGELSCSFDQNVAFAYLLMSMFNFGDDNRLTQHYARIAHSICDHIPETPERHRLRDLLENGRLMEGAWPEGRRLPHVHTTSGAPPQRENFATDQLLVILRTFPIHAPLYGISCQLLMAERAPVSQRTDSYIPYEKAAILLEALMMGERMFATYRSQTVTEMDVVSTIFEAALKATRVGLCGAAGLVSLGSRYVRDTWDNLKNVPLMLIGFNYNMYIHALLQLAQFAIMYKRNPVDPGARWDAFVTQIAEAILPIVEFYNPARLAYDTLTEIIENPPAEIFVASEWDGAAYARWARVPDAATAVAAEMMSARRDVRTSLVRYLWNVGNIVHLHQPSDSSLAPLYSDPLEWQAATNHVAVAVPTAAEPATWSFNTEFAPLVRLDSASHSHVDWEPFSSISTERG